MLGYHVLHFAPCVPYLILHPALYHPSPLISFCALPQAPPRCNISNGTNAQTSLDLNLIVFPFIEIETITFYNERTL